MRQTRAVTLWLLPVVLSGACHRRVDTAAAAKWVQAFYDWYVPAGAPAGVNHLYLWAKRRGSFGPELAAALQTDNDAQAADPGEITGLDFDPVLNSQDPCSRYRVSGSREQAGRVFVSVLGEGDCQQHTAADVIAEVAPTGDSWEFVNFQNSSGQDLLAILRNLAKMRAERTGRSL